ncbi:MBOAT family O-acyltransferase [Roseivirga sp. UBA1976]|uniref:MBOAT family O-acyltransferase n=1 Tax=Roseivirga sp. UBA1976 TaxID=1947386 RepID=UPI00258098CE|nr:MBOAT family O-acyltransferase [Roseivirga sp. UBA1976]|tara:strand:+ start:2457 stop:3908 length:1452 start_codon:yes stop_codon:yes gene_type:complete
MLFNSFDFAIFLPVVFLLYWFVFKHSLRLQNALIVVASYVFYGWWDWRFLSLILFSTLVDFLVGKQLGKEAKDNKRRLWLWLSVVVNLGFLGFFKYFNFFLENFQAAFSFFGFEIGGRALSIVLPVGISFYTFQTLSYTIDVYKRKLKPTQDFIAFAAFVSFFPQLVAGPIERATHLLPQFYRKRQFSYPLAANGCRQILWGFFKKLVIADNCAEYANLIFNNSESYSGSTLFLGALFFAFQIYGDFSGYSDIAIGTSRLFGFDLMKNFAFPYFSRDIAEFWRRWHISLSTWFRDYVYIPLGGSRGSKWGQVRNVFIIFLVSGFWHGANWTFMVWGGLNALYFLPLFLLKLNRSNMEVVAERSSFPSAKELLQMGITFILTVLAWVSFRAEDIAHAWQIYAGIFDSTLFTVPREVLSSKLLMCIVLVLFFVFVEWLGRRREFAIEYLLEAHPRWLRWSWYIFLIFLMGMFMQTEETPFIYFQF